MERQEKKKKAIEDPETDEVQKTFLEKLKSFFCFCTAKKTADKRPLTDEPEKTFLEKMKSFFCFCIAKNTKVQKPVKSVRTYIKTRSPILCFM